MNTPRTFDRKATEDILRRALETETVDDGLSEAELADIAASVGVSPEALRKATDLVLAEQAVRSEEESVGLEVDKRLRAESLSLKRHIGTWLVASLGFLALQGLTGGEWALFPILGWGVAVAMHAIAHFFRDENEIREKIRKRRARHREVRQVISRTKEVVRDPKALEAALERGLGLLLDKATQHIDRAVSNANSAVGVRVPPSNGDEEVHERPLDARQGKRSR